MKVWKNLMFADMKRAICSPAFLFTALAMTFVEVISAGMILTNLAFGVTEILDNFFAGTGSAYLLIMLFPLFPYALAYARGEQERSSQFWIVRTGPVRYLISKFWAACLSAILVLALSFVLFSLLLLTMGHPLCNPLAYQMEEPMRGYLRFLQEGNVAAYLILYTLDRGMSAAMMAACAVCLSCCYPNPYFAAAAPICVYHLVLKAFPDIAWAPLLPATWIEMTYASPSGGWVSFLCKLGVTLLVCTVYAVIAVGIIQRRWRHA